MMKKDSSLVSLYAGLPHTSVWDISTLRHRVILLKSVFLSIHYESDEYFARLTSVMSDDRLDSV